MTASSDKSGLPLGGRTVLVTGANGGLGREFVTQALERGARKVYAAARTPRNWPNAQVRPLSRWPPMSIC